MNKGNLNKLVTNYPVDLTEEEIKNLSGTLAPVIAACGGGGVTGDYYSASNPSGFINSAQAETQILEKHYLTEASGDLLYVPIPEGLSEGQYYAMTTSSWKVIQGAGDVSGISTVAHDDTLTGNGNNENLGVDTTKIQTKLTEPQIQNITDVTTLKTASSTWDNVTAKLGTAQYANDSATFVTSSNDSISAAGEQYALTTTGWSKVQAGSTLTAGSGVEIVSNGINALLGTDLAFNATTSAIQINTNGIVYGAYAFVEGSNTTASGAGAHAEGVDAGAIGQGAHAGGYGTHTTGVGNFIHGTFLNFASPDGTSVNNTPVFVGGTLNATTSQDYTDHDGYLQIMGNGVYRSGGQGDKSDAYILYRDGTVSAKQFQNADGTETINGTTYNFSGVDNIEILPNAATANTANFPNDNVLRFILES